MILYNLSVLFVPLMVVLIAYAINTKYKRRRLITIFIIVLLCALGFADNVSYLLNRPVTLPDKVVFEDDLNLELTRTTSRSYLSMDGEEVTYITYRNQDPFYLEKYMPVYLEEIDSYYIVIFSEDKDTVFEYNRFRQGDYERYDMIDQLVVIEKSTGYIFSTTDYDLIGMEIDLNSFQEGQEIVTFNVFLPYEEKISYVRYMYIEEEYSMETHGAMYQNFESDPMGGDWLGMIGHHHTLGDPSWIVTFELSHDFYFYQDSYGTTYAGNLNQRDGWIEFTQNVDLTNEIFARDGYYKLVDDGIYYLNNNRQLIYEGRYITSVIATNVPLDEWEDYIPVDGV